MSNILLGIQRYVQIQVDIHKRETIQTTLDFCRMKRRVIFPIGVGLERVLILSSRLTMHFNLRGNLRTGITGIPLIGTRKIQKDREINYSAVTSGCFIYHSAIKQ